MSKDNKKMIQAFDHILIGGSGFVSFHLRLKLEKQKVLIIDVNKPRSLKKNESFLKCDIRQDFTEIISSFKFSEFTVLHHLAAVHFDFQKDFFETNVTGTKNVIDTFSKNISKWIFYSSVATYGDSEEIRYEFSDQKPTNDYGKSKLLMEKEIINYIKTGRLNGKVVIVRPGVVYGEWNFGNVFNLMKLSVDILPIGLDKTVVKSMAYVGNLVSSTLYAIDKCEKSKPFIYNYVDYNQIETVWLLKELGKVQSKKVIQIPYKVALFVSALISVPFKWLGRDSVISPERVAKFAQPTHFKADKIRELGWSQPVQTTRAISLTLSWIKNNDVVNLRRKWKSDLSNL